MRMTMLCGMCYMRTHGTLADRHYDNAATTRCERCHRFLADGYMLTGTPAKELKNVPLVGNGSTFQGWIEVGDLRPGENGVVICICGCGSVHTYSGSEYEGDAPRTLPTDTMGKFLLYISPEAAADRTNGVARQRRELPTKPASVVIAEGEPYVFDGKHWIDSSGRHHLGREVPASWVYGTVVPDVDAGDVVDFDDVIGWLLRDNNWL